MKGLGNDNHIVYIEINKEAPSKFIEYRPEKRILGIKVQEEGFYFESFLLPSIPKNMFINNQLVMHKPHIIIEYSNGRAEYKYFNKDEEMFLYLKREFQDRHWRKYE